MQRDDFFAAIDASPSERAAFEALDALFLETASHTNLVARSSLGDRWERHFMDSAQLMRFIPPNTRDLLDIGSGAGFPGLVIGILARERMPDLRLQLCDSVGKKTAYLQGAVDALGLSSVTVLTGRVEEVAPKRAFDIVTARAVTALDRLIGLAAPHLKSDGSMIFPKGGRAQLELDDARKRWSFEVETYPSLTHAEASILRLSSPKRTS